MYTIFSIQDQDFNDIYIGYTNKTLHQRLKWIVKCALLPSAKPRAYNEPMAVWLRNQIKTESKIVLVKLESVYTIIEAQYARDSYVRDSDTLLRFKRTSNRVTLGDRHRRAKLKTS